MANPLEVVKKLKEATELTVQVGREGDIIAEPPGYISTRCPTLDYLIGRPGVPLGGITLLVGAYGSGKSTILQAILAEGQAGGGQAVLFDTEGRFNFDRAAKLGIDVDKLILAQPDTLEAAFAGVKQMIATAREVLGENEHIVIGLDSIAGAPMRKELKGESMGLGDQAKLIKRELRIMSNLVNRQRIALVVTSQPRMKINLGAWGGSTTTWVGEDPLGHSALTTIRLEEKSKFGDDPNSPIGHQIRATLVDTRISGCTEPTCKDCRRKDFKRLFDFYDATGPDFFGSALDVLMEKKVVEYKNGWYLFRGHKFRKAQFETKATTELPELLDMLGEILKGGHFNVA